MRIYCWNFEFEHFGSLVFVVDSRWTACWERVVGCFLTWLSSSRISSSEINLSGAPLCERFIDISPLPVIGSRGMASMMWPRFCEKLWWRPTLRNVLDSSGFWVRRCTLKGQVSWVKYLCKLLVGICICSLMFGKSSSGSWVSDSTISWFIWRVISLSVLATKWIVKMTTLGS